MTDYAPADLPGILADLTTTLARMVDHPDLVRTLARRNPLYIADEYNSVTNDSTLEVWPKSGNAERITGVLAVTPATGVTSATLTLGQRIIPVQNTTWSPGPVDWLLLPNERRILTIVGTTGPLFLWLWGEEQPGATFAGT